MRVAPWLVALGLAVVIAGASGAQAASPEPVARQERACLETGLFPPSVAVDPGYCVQIVVGTVKSLCAFVTILCKPPWAQGPEGG
jgi:hypothetical protein